MISRAQNFAEFLLDSFWYFFSVLSDLILNNCQISIWTPKNGVEYGEQFQMKMFLRIFKLEAGQQICALTIKISMSS